MTVGCAFIISPGFVCSLILSCLYLALPANDICNQASPVNQEPSMKQAGSSSSPDSEKASLGSLIDGMCSKTVAPFIFWTDMQAAGSPSVPALVQENPADKFCTLCRLHAILRAAGVFRRRVPFKINWRRQNGRTSHGCLSLWRSWARHYRCKRS